MPSGVEHISPAMEVAAMPAVVAASMPSGVEHWAQINAPNIARDVVAASMPSGVEHNYRTARWRPPESRRRFDALGR